MLLKESPALSLLRDVTGEARDWRLLVSLLRWKVLLVCWLWGVTAFTKSWIRLASFLSPMLRRGSSATEASGSSASEHVEELPAVVVSFKQTDFSTPIGLLPIRLFLWGGAPPMYFGAYHGESSMWRKITLYIRIKFLSHVYPFIISPNLSHHWLIIFRDRLYESKHAITLQWTIIRHRLGNIIGSIYTAILYTT